MKFYVHSKDGQKFGPADIATLNQWIKEGRLSRDTELEEDETEKKRRARDVAGLDFPAAASDLGGNDPVLKAKEPIEQQPVPHRDPSGQPTPYIAGTSEGVSPYQEPPSSGSPHIVKSYSTDDDGTPKMITNAWIMTGLGFLFGCIILPPFAIYQANRAKRMGNPNGQAPLVVAWILLSIHIVAYSIWGIILLLPIIEANS